MTTATRVLATLALVVLLLPALALFVIAVSAGQVAAAGWMLVPIGIIYLFLRLTWERA